MMRRGHPLRILRYFFKITQAQKAYAKRAKRYRLFAIYVRLPRKLSSKAELLEIQGHSVYTLCA